MTKTMLPLFALFFVLGAGVDGRPRGGSAQDVDAHGDVPKSFSYPKSGESEDLGTILAPEVAGRVVDANGKPVAKALVERLSRDERRRVEAKFTDDDGRFRFDRVHGGQHSIRISLTGFDTMLLRLRVVEDFSTPLELTMTPGT